MQKDSEEPVKSATEDEAEIRGLKIMKARKKFSVNDKSPAIRSLYLPISEGEIVICRTLADPGEWVYATRFKKPNESGFVPWDYIEQVTEPSVETQSIQDHQKAIDKLKSKNKLQEPPVPRPGALDVIPYRLVGEVKEALNSKKVSKIPKYKQLVKMGQQWGQACEHFKAGKVGLAIEIFKLLALSLQHANLYFNLAQCYVLLKNWGQAIFNLNQAINLNSGMAIAYFVRGCIYYKRKDYLLAILDYSDVLQLLRGRNYINYRPLGLNYVISRGEVYYNRCLSFAAFGINERALEDIQLAMRHRYDHSNHFIMTKLRNELAQESGEGAQNFLLPHGLRQVGLIMFAPGAFSAEARASQTGSSSSSSKSKPRNVNPLAAEMMRKKVM